MAELQSDQLFDVVVVGTGVSGALAAYHFQSAGLHVLMLQAAPPLPADNDRSEMGENYARSPTKFPQSPYAPYVAPQPNRTDNTIDGSDYYDQPKINPPNSNPPDKLFNSYYQRTVGGAMAHWQGIAIRMVP